MTNSSDWGKLVPNSINLLLLVKCHKSTDNEVQITQRNFAYNFIHFKFCVEKKNQKTFSFLSANISPRIHKIL